MTKTPPQRPVMTAESHNEESHPAWWKPWNWPAGIWMLLIGGFILMVPFGIRAVILSTVPAMNEPFDVDAFVKWDVPEDQDAFTHYRQASQLRARLVSDLVSRSVPEPENYAAVLEKGWAEADEPVKKWLELHREALTVWRRGTELEHALNLSPAHLSFDSVLNVIQDQRLFTRLAVLESARCLDAGQLDEARQWARGAFRSGGHTSHRGCLIQGLVGVAIHAMSTDSLARWAEQPAVTSEQLKAALAEAKADYGLYESRSNILKSEYMACRNSLSSPQWVQLIGPANSVDISTPGVAAAVKGGYWVVGEPELSLRVFRQMLANQLQEIDKPVSARRKMVGTGIAMLFDPDPAVPLLPAQLDPAGIDRGVKQSFLIRMLGPAMLPVDTAQLRQSSRQAALELLLAVQAYQRDHGEYPETLSQLVPEYLSAVPLDPCDPAGGPMLYRRDDPSKAVVWSMGDDKADGGGNVVGPNGRSADTGFVIKTAQGTK